ITVGTEMPRDPAVGLYIVTVGTPLDTGGRVRLDMVRRVTEQIAGRLKDGDAVVLRSTVKIGTSRNVVLPILEATGRRFDLAFCPERTLEGQALYELAHLPQIVGALTPAGAARLAQVFNAITPTVIRVRDPETAEMIKLVDNTSRDVGFAFANEVARMCGTVGVSAAEVIKFGKLGYPRTNVPIPGPVGGPCLSKDGHILIESMERYGMVPEIASASRRINERLMVEVAQYLAVQAPPHSGPPHSGPLKIAVLGLAFKGRPETNDLRGSTVHPLLEALRARLPEASYHGYDPVVSADEQRDLGLTPAASLEEAFDGCHTVVIHNNHVVFAGMPLARLSNHMARPGLVYDFWNSFDPDRLEMAPGTRYVALGGHPVPVAPGLVQTVTAVLTEDASGTATATDALVPSVAADG
ncbi:MAG TPA: nucleotide sugar dehydrogenase, partial [Arenibaculum sp.]|nr:nucleotide sugar dehydrogenase [Arenibaculum sp.]